MKKNISIEDQCYFLEMEGYCVVDNAISMSSILFMRDELTKLERVTRDSSFNRPNREHKNSPTRFMIHELQFEDCSEVHKLISRGRCYDILSHVTGDNLVCISATYAHCKPGYLGLPIHTDYDPYKNNLYRPNNPVALRVIFYLDDLSPKKAPFRLIPRSHLSLHKKYYHNAEFTDNLIDEIEITCKAGTAIIINTKVLHGVGPNITKLSRRVLAITYRPRWAKPVYPVAEHSEANINLLHSSLIPLFSGLNDSNVEQ